MDDWIDRMADALGQEHLTPEEVEVLLTFTRDVAHGVERKLAPLSAYVAGLWVGAEADGGGASRAEALARAIRTAAELIPPVAARDLRPLPERKAAVREQMKAARSAISSEDLATMAERIEARLVEVPEVREARTVLLFSSFGSEVPTAGMAERFIQRGQRVLLPFIEASQMQAAELRPGQPLVATAFGPQEPAERVAVDPAEVDVVIAPGLAFDREGRRIGYGGGYYDRFLRRLGPHATRIGIGTHGQVVDEVPHGRRDERLHLIVTDQETIDCRVPEAP